MNFPFRVAGRLVTASYYGQETYSHRIVLGGVSIYIVGHADAVARVHAEAIVFMLSNGVKSMHVDGVNIYRE